jgi:hypothetical protein
MQAARKMVTQNHMRGKKRQNTEHATTERGKEIYPGKAQPQEGKRDRIQYMPTTGGRERMNTIQEPPQNRKGD